MAMGFQQVLGMYSFVGYRWVDVPKSKATVCVHYNPRYYQLKEKNNITEHGILCRIYFALTRKCLRKLSIQPFCNTHFIWPPHENFHVELFTYCLCSVFFSPPQPKTRAKSLMKMYSIWIFSRKLSIKIQISDLKTQRQSLHVYKSEMIILMFWRQMKWGKSRV